MKQNSVESGFINAGAAAWIPPTTTFASPPASPATGSVYLFTDALTPGATVGGGTSLSTCRWSGTAWVSAGAGPATTIQDEGVILTQRTTLNFVGLGVTATDDSANGRTVVTIPGASQTPWTQDIDGAGFTLKNVTALGIGMTNPQVSFETAGSMRILGNQAPSSGSGLELAFDGNTGYVQCLTRPNPGWKAIYFNASVFAFNTGNVGIGNTGSPPFSAAGYVHSTVGPQTSSAQCGIITACSNTTVIPQAVGSFCFANYSLATADKRIAEIRGDTDTSTDSGRLVFSTWNAGTIGTRILITAAGLVGVGTASPSVNLEIGASGQPMLGFQSTGGTTGNQRGALIWDGGPGLGMGGWVFQKRTDAGAFAANLVTILNSGNVGINKINPGTRLAVSGLPTSSAGLTSGDIWYDIAAGNVLKIIP